MVLRNTNITDVDLSMQKSNGYGLLPLLSVLDHARMLPVASITSDHSARWRESNATTAVRQSMLSIHSFELNMSEKVIDR